MEFAISNPEETEALAKTIGKTAEAGNIVLLIGDLGAGKTTMTKGIALGLGIEQMIKSPTYTIIREYSSGRLPLYHMDIYRLNGEVEDLGLEEYFEGEGLSVVEWGNLLEQNMLEDYLSVTIEKNPDFADKRTIKLQAFGEKSTSFLKRISNERVNK